VLVMTQVFEHELLVVVLLLLVDVEVGTVEVEEAVRYLVAGEGSHYKLAIVPVKHSATRKAARCLQW